MGCLMRSQVYGAGRSPRPCSASASTKTKSLPSRSPDEKDGAEAEGPACRAAGSQLFPMGAGIEMWLWHGAQRGN